MSTETEVEEKEVDTTSVSRYPKTRKDAIEQHLKNLLMQDMAIRNTINGAKTNAKKAHYNKKLKKITTESKKMIAALRRIEDPNA